MLTDMSSGDSVTETDSRNIGCIAGLLVGGAIVSFAGPLRAVPCATLGGSIGGAIGGTAK